MGILCLFGDLSSLGGIQKINKDLKRALEENGHRCFVLTMRGLPVLKVLGFVYKTLTHVINHRPDLIICGHINFSPLCLFVKKVFNVDYAVLAYGIEAWGLRNRLQVAGLANAKLILPISRYTAERISSRLPMVRNRIAILPCAVDNARFFPRSKSLDLIKKLGLLNKRVILTVARLASSERYKGYDKVIRSMPQVLKEFPDVKYLIVGDGDDMPRAERLKDSLELGDKVVFVGGIPNEEMSNYYNLCDVFVMPSTGEGFGAVFIEALACGKLVIAGDRGGSRDAVLDGEIGILVDPDNVEEIGRAITKALKRDIEKRITDSNYLRKRVTEEYGFNRFKERVRHIITSLK